ncbi:nicotinamide mononucleotide permease [Lecanosticta acicola]|uniref:Nicotinamide mononucleotide permease n=1 Tax=Lecanosticta acicola TaxID=111012 RepID=A0AAI8YSS9_9PEZI|nr:nicotinamide mononucleotide permease [Lecanosticta acicola]
MPSPPSLKVGLRVDRKKKDDCWVGVAPSHLNGEEPYHPGSEAEKKLLRKLDMRIITGGLEKDFNLTSDQYSVVLLVFFVSYITFQIPSNMLISKVRPSLYLPGLAVLWGGVAASMAGTHNWRQLAAVRFALGIAEAGFAPGIAFYLSCWYKRYELAQRFSWYYTAVATSGMVSGLLSGLITRNLDGAHGIAGWRWLFIIEGVGSSGLGLIVWSFMADYPSTTAWLTPEERILASQRLAHDGIGDTQGSEERIKKAVALKMTVTDWRVWALSLLHVLITGSQTMQYFIPTLVRSFGWSGFGGQYHTIPPYAFALVCTLVFSFVSDHYQNRPLFISLFASITTVFFIAAAATTGNTVRYIFTILAFGSIYGTVPLIITWVANVIAYPAEKRAVALALANALGNVSSIYGVFLWPSSDRPRYTHGFSVTTTWMGLIAILAPLMAWGFELSAMKAPTDPETGNASHAKFQRDGDEERSI